MSSPSVRKTDPQILGAFVLALLVFLTVGLLVPLTTTTIVDRLNEPKRFIGYAIGAMTLGAFLGRILAGAIVDALGTRRGFFVALTILIGSGVVYLVAPTVQSFLVARFAHGVGEAMVYTCAATVVVARSPADKRSRYLGLLGSAVWGGLSLGPALVDWSSWLNRTEGAGIITIGAGVAGFAVIGRIIPAFSPPGAVTGVSSAEAPRRLRLALPRGAVLPSVTIGFYNLAYAAITGFVILHLREQSLEPKFALTFYGVAVLFGRVLLGGIPDRLGPRPSLAIGLTMMFCALTVIFVAPSLIAVRIALMVFGVGYSMPFPALASVAVDRTSKSERASTIAMLGFVYDAFVFVAGVAYGVLADANRLDWIFYIGLGGIATGLALAMYVSSESQNGPALTGAEGKSQMGRTMETIV